MQQSEMWTYRDASETGYDPTAGIDLTGFEIEALDGSIGKVDKATNEVDKSYVIVDTGPWIFGKKVMLPAGVIQRIDADNARVWVNRTKDQIKDAPEFDETRAADSAYYGEGGQGYRAF
jgi:hypothetical protein